VMLVFAPPVPVTETVPLPVAVTWPATSTPKFEVSVAKPPAVPVTATAPAEVIVDVAEMLTPMSATLDPAEPPVPATVTVDPAPPETVPPDNCTPNAAVPVVPPRPESVTVPL